MTISLKQYKAKIKKIKCWGPLNSTPLSHHKKLHIVFVNFRQEYDSVTREALWEHLKLFGIPAKLKAIIRMCIGTAKCKLRFGKTHFEEFKPTVGIKQGDALSPILFNIALEVVARIIHDKYEVIDFGKSASILAYADDIVELGETENGIQLATEELIRSAKTIGFGINKNKT